MSGELVVREETRRAMHHLCALVSHPRAILSEFLDNNRRREDTEIKRAREEAR